MSEIRCDLCRSGRRDGQILAIQEVCSSQTGCDDPAPNCELLIDSEGKHIVRDGNMCNRRRDGGDSLQNLIGIDQSLADGVMAPRLPSHKVGSHQERVGGKPYLCDRSMNLYPNGLGERICIAVVQRRDFDDEVVLYVLRHSGRNRDYTCLRVDRNPVVVAYEVGAPGALEQRREGQRDIVAGVLICKLVWSARQLEDEGFVREVARRRAIAQDMNVAPGIAGPMNSGDRHRTPRGAGNILQQTPALGPVKVGAAVCPGRP